MKEEPMKKSIRRSGDEPRPEHDLRALLKNGIPGKYAKSYRAGTNLVLLEPDVSRVFHDQASVNEALRLVIRLGKLASSK